MTAAIKITIGKFDSTSIDDDGEAYVYANGEPVGEIFRRSIREFAYSGPYFVKSYDARIWLDDVGNNDPEFEEAVRDYRGRQLQTPAQAKRAIKHQIAEYLNA